MDPLTVLIVDDNEDAANSLAALIRLLGHRSMVAYDALTGLRLARRLHPDLVIHDIALPGMSGYEAARRLRENPVFRHMRLVAHTAYCTDRDRQKSKEAGFDQHMGKPMDPALLSTLLSSIVAQPRPQ